MTNGHRSTPAASPQVRPPRLGAAGATGWALLALLAFGAWSPGHAAAAEMLCGARGEILAQLAERYASRPLPLGFSPDGGRLEVLTSPDGGWTMLVTYPDRPTCVVASGEAWQNLGLVGQPV